MKLSNEAKVGGLILATGVLAIAFAWIIGIQNPFNQSVEYYVTYNFAGGIEVGSPVRVSGIKVGKVEKIERVEPDGERFGSTFGTAGNPFDSRSVGSSVGSAGRGSSSASAAASTRLGIDKRFIGISAQGWLQRSASRPTRRVRQPYLIQRQDSGR